MSSLPRREEEHTEEKVELAVINEGYKTFSINRTPANNNRKTFTVPVSLLNKYLDVKRQLENLQERLMSVAREQGAYAPLKDKPMRERMVVEEGEIIKLD
jgi:hypothetical protein